MQKNRVLFAFVAILFGVFIVTISLFAYASNKTAQFEKKSTTTFYLSRTILPDHVLYPVLMMFDRGLLFVSRGEPELYLRIRLAQDRMLRAQKLLEKGDEVLALSTLTKSQKYLLLAGQHYLSKKDQFPLAAGTAVLHALQENTINLQESEKRFQTISTVPIEDLIRESSTLITIIENTIQ